jgi:hypothetical protein
MNLDRSSPPNFGRRLACAALALALLPAASAAITWKNIQLGGFFSQGYLDSTNNNYPVDTKDGTFDFREYGLNASTTFGSHFRVGAQAFAQKLGKFGDDKIILDWAVADYNFRQEIGIRIGRVKYPRSLHSDVLDADVLRPFIFLPQTIYDPRLRDFQASFDGGMVYGSINAGSSSFDYKVYYGDIPMKTDSGVGDYFNTSSLFRNPPGVRELDMDAVKGATVAWNTPISGLRIAGYYSTFSHLVASGPFFAVPVLTSSVDLTKVEYKAASIEYTWDKWTFAGEYLLEDISTIVSPPAMLAPPSNSQSKNKSFYVSVARRLTDKLEVGTYYTELTNGSPPTPGNPPSSTYRRDWTISGRFDVNEHLLFKLEVHFIDGTRDIFNVPGISNPPGSLKDSMVLFAAKTTVSF